MHHRHGERQPLPDAQWQVRRQIVAVVLELEAMDQLRYTLRDLWVGQMEQACMKI